MKRDNDMVNHPKHYLKNGIECFDVIKAYWGDDAFENFCLCNALKYIMRCKDKGNYVQDIKKAIFYLNEIVGMYSEDNRKALPCEY